MAFVLGKGFVDMDLETGKFDSNLTRAEGKLKRFDAGLKRFASGAKRVLTGLTAVGFFSVRAGIRRQDAIANLEASLESMGQTAGMTKVQIMQFGKELHNATGQGKTEIYDMLAAIHTFGNIGPGVFKRTAMASIDLAAKLKTDLRSAMIQLSKAIEDPTKGLTAMTRSGVSFSRAEQQIIKDLHAANRLFEAQSMILDKVEQQVGGTALKQNQGLSKSVNEMKEAFEDIKVVLADVFTPAVKRLSEMLKFVADRMDNLTPGQKEVAGWGILGTAITGVTAIVGSWVLAAASHAKNLGLLKTAAGQTTKSVEALTRMLSVGKVTYTSASGEASVMALKFKETAAAAADAVTPLNKAAAATNKVAGGSKLAKGGLVALAAAAGLAIAALIQWGRDQDKTFGQIYDDWTDGIDTMTKNVVSFKDAIKVLDDTINDVYKTLGSGGGPMQIFIGQFKNLEKLAERLWNLNRMGASARIGVGSGAQSVGSGLERAGRFVGQNPLGDLLSNLGRDLFNYGKRKEGVGIRQMTEFGRGDIGGQDADEQRRIYERAKRRRQREAEENAARMKKLGDYFWKSLAAKAKGEGAGLMAKAIWNVQVAKSRISDMADLFNEKVGLKRVVGSTKPGMDAMAIGDLVKGILTAGPPEVAARQMAANSIMGAAAAFDKLSTAAPSVAEKQRDKQINLLEDIKFETEKMVIELKKKAAALFGK